MSLDGSTNQSLNLGDGKENDQEKIVLSLTKTAFETLERDFQEVLIELSGKDQLENFRIEYEKLHRTLLRCHESEKRLMKKCEELTQQIVANAIKVQTAINLSKEDQNTIAILKKEIDKAWKLVNASHEKEAKAKETVQKLTKEISELTKIANQGTGNTIQDASAPELEKVKRELAREKEMKNAQIISLNNELSNMQIQITDANQEKKKLVTVIESITEQLNETKNKLDQTIKQKEKSEKELKESKQLLTAKAQELQKKDESIRKEQIRVFDSDKIIKEMEQSINSLQKRIDQYKSVIEQDERERSGLIAEVSRLKANDDKLNIEKKLLENKIKEVIDEKNQWHQSYQMLQQKKKVVENEKEEIERSKDTLNQEIIHLNKIIEELNQQKDQQVEASEKIKAERNYLSKSLVLVRKEKTKKQDNIKILEGNSKVLKAEIVAERKQTEKYRQLTYTLEKERERYASEASDSDLKYRQALEEVRIKTVELNELQKKIIELQEKLKTQQSLYESVRSERNTKSKALIAAHEEAEEMKKQFKIMEQQITQLKDEITSREKALVDETYNAKQILKKKEKMKEEIKLLEEKQKEQERIIKSHETENYRLTQIIKQADNERRKQQKDYDAVVSERDVLGTQLIRRNDEIALLYEKIQLQNSTLDKGAIQYRERLGDIKILKLKIKDLTRQLQVLKKHIYKIKEYQRENHELKRNLLEERNKVKALSEELQNPMNVHRWRKLEGSDPTQYELVLKTQTLQKRLIAKTEEVMEKDLIVQEKEEMNKKLKSILSRQPGPEVAEQLNIYQETLRKKNSQIQSLASELNFLQYKDKQQEYEKERLNRELKDTKKKFLQTKKDFYLEKERSQSHQHLSGEEIAGDPVYKVTPPEGTRIHLGGGFALN